MATTDSSPQAVEQVLLDAIVELGPDRDQVTPDATFEALDIDSLDLVEIAQVIEEKWGVELEADDVKDIKTVREARDLVLARINSGE